jgi:O-antigen ligase
MRKREKEISANLVLLTSTCTTLAVSPWWTYDPIGIPKMSVLTILSIPILFILIRYLRNSFMDKDLVVISSLGFLISIFLTLFLSGADKVQQIYGTAGRSIGALTLLGFMFVFLGAMYAVSESYIRKFSLNLIGVGALSAIYGLIQYFQVDPINWINPYSPVIGFLGNPNFQSSFIGINFVFLLGYLFSNVLNAQLKVIGVLIELLFLFNIYGSESQQGFVIAALGSAWVFFNVIKSSPLKRLQIPYLGAAGIGALLVAFGALNIGPLSKFIYTESVTFRGDYWRAGIKMFMNHPIFGVGIDNYGNWYTRTRDLLATTRPGGNVVANEAHNVFIDMASNGGLLLIISYVAINLCVVAAILRTAKRLQTFDPFFVGLSASWIAFQAQSIVSINQIGLSIWGWALGGSIIGYTRFIKSKITHLDQQSEDKRKKQTPTRPMGIDSKIVLLLVVGLIVGGSLGLPPYIAETRYMTAIQSGDANKIEGAAYITPNSPRRMIQVAVAFQGNELPEQALIISLDASKKYPDYLDGWKFLYQLPNITPDLKKKALVQIQRLDPLNPEFK